MIAYVFTIRSLKVKPVLDIDTSYEAYYNGPVSDHFDGERFYNPWNKRPKKGFFDILKWRVSGKRAEWPETVHNPERPPLAQDRQDLTVTYIGHATFLVQVKGYNLLVDPFFSERASPFAAFGPQRVRPPFVPIDGLPVIHGVFVSHNHYDHMDLPSLAWLNAVHKPAFITPLGNDRLIKSCCSGGVKVTTLDWNQSIQLGDGSKLTLTPAQHWSRRGLNDANRDLWGGFYLETDLGSLYYSSDTGFDKGLFERIYNTYGAPDIALLPIGAYAPRWFMKYSHMNPEEALDTHTVLKARQSMGFHHETLQLSDEPFDDARQTIDKGVSKKGLEKDAFVVPYPGDSLTARKGT